MVFQKLIITIVVLFAVHSIASPVPVPLFFWSDITQTNSESNGSLSNSNDSNTTELVVPFDKDTIDGYDFSYTYYGMPGQAIPDNHQQHSDIVKNASLEHKEMSSTPLATILEVKDSKDSSTPSSSVTTTESDAVPVPSTSAPREKRQLALVIGGYPGYYPGYGYGRYGGYGYGRPWGGGGWGGRGGWRGGYGGRGGWGGGRGGGPGPWAYRG